MPPVIWLLVPAVVSLVTARVPNSPWVKLSPMDKVVLSCTVIVPLFTTETAFQNSPVPGPVTVRLAPLSMVRLPT